MIETNVTTISSHIYSNENSIIFLQTLDAVSTGISILEVNANDGQVITYVSNSATDVVAYEYSRIFEADDGTLYFTGISSIADNYFLCKIGFSFNNIQWIYPNNFHLILGMVPISGNVYYLISQGQGPNK